MSGDFSQGGTSPHQPGPYQPSSAPGSGQPAKTSGKAIASLVLGILSFMCTLFTGIPAIIFGILSLKEINSSNGKVQGSGLATAGIVTGSVGTLLLFIAGPIILGLLLPAVQATRLTAQRLQSSNNLKQVALALHSYQNQYRTFPAAYTTDEDGQPLTSWRVAILSFLERYDLERAYHQDEPWNSPANEPLASTGPDFYHSPLAIKDPDSGPPEVNVLAIVGPDTFLSSEGPVKMDDVSDGLSNTIIGVELAGARLPWTAPKDITIDEFVAAMKRAPSDAGLRSLYRGGALCMFGDGSVRFVASDTDPATLRALCTRNGGEVVTAPFD